MTPRSVISVTLSRFAACSVERFQCLTSSSSTPQRGLRITKSGCRPFGPIGTLCQTM